MDRFFLANVGETVATSAVLTVSNWPVQVRVYGIPGTETVHWQVVEEVIDLTATGTRCFGVDAHARVAHFATYIKSSGCVPQLDSTHTTMYLTEPGSYRAIVSAGAIGLVTIVVQENRMPVQTYTDADLGCASTVVPPSCYLTLGAAQYDFAGARVFTFVDCPPAQRGVYTALGFTVQNDFSGTFQTMMSPTASITCGINFTEPFYDFAGALVGYLPY
jgi:hypothetical protein